MFFSNNEFEVQNIFSRFKVVHTLRCVLQGRNSDITFYLKVLLPIHGHRWQHYRIKVLYIQIAIFSVKRLNLYINMLTNKVRLQLKLGEIFNSGKCLKHSTVFPYFSSLLISLNVHTSSCLISLKVYIAVC